MAFVVGFCAGFFAALVILLVEEWMRLRRDPIDVLELSRRMRRADDAVQDLIEAFERFKFRAKESHDEGPGGPRSPSTSRPSS